jgi:polysaccharide pyruvyl transferase WcaK-like protein
MLCGGLAKEDSTLIDVFVGKRWHCQIFSLYKKGTPTLIIGCDSSL